MKRFRIFLSVVGVLALVATLSGCYRFRLSSSSGFQAYPFTSVSVRIAVGVIGICLTALGRWASARTLWYVGCAIFGLVFFGFLAQGTAAAVREPDTFGRIWGGASQVLCAVILAMVFSKWWLPKRRASGAP